MDLLVPLSWLKKHLETKASYKDIAKYMSLCGPSFERIKEIGSDIVFSVEVTTNRVDSASIRGIAQEAQAILPRFGFSAKLREDVDAKKPQDVKLSKKVNYLDVSLDSKLCPRFSAVLIENVEIKNSPKEIADLLTSIGLRPINNVVDISNFIMHDLGQPVHTFDYDKIVGHKMILRESKKGEKITTLDGKTFELVGGDIVIEDGSGKIIDLCGIMGGQNSAIDNNTKNVLLFVQNYNQHKIRKTSMTLSQRTEAAALFEKGLDSEQVEPALYKALSMFEKMTGGVYRKEILDIYPSKYKTRFVKTSTETINKIIGVNISQKEIEKYLVSLGFDVTVKGSEITVGVPSIRAKDIEIPEDIAEEIARIYGYHNLPNNLMTGSIPQKSSDGSFELEKRIKEILYSLGGVEIYNLSLTSKQNAGSRAIKLKNPLGAESEYLRTNLRNSLLESLNQNNQEKDTLHLYEMANVYLPKVNDLPEEKLMLSGVIRNGNFRENSGILQTLLNELEIDYQLEITDMNGFLASQAVKVISDKKKIGEYGNIKPDVFYYEFPVQEILKAKRLIREYKEVSKYPPQIEDITVEIPERTFVGDIIKKIYKASSKVVEVTLQDTYQNKYTFNIKYHDKNKTLTDEEVKKERSKILATLFV